MTAGIVSRIAPADIAPAGSLWERASDVDKSATDSRGYFVAYFVTSPKGDYPAGRQGFDTPAGAQAWIDARATWPGTHVIVAHRFTKSGKVYRFA